MFILCFCDFLPNLLLIRRLLVIFSDVEVPVLRPATGELLPSEEGCRFVQHRHQAPVGLGELCGELFLASISKLVLVFIMDQE